MTRTPHKTIVDWIGDVVALESHVEEALDRQLKLEIDDPQLAGVIQAIHDTCRDSKHRAEAFQKEEGTTAGNPVIKAGTELLGKAAGVIDRVRKDSVAKALRDDYTAINLLTISYSMLYTTALALGDERTRSFAEQGAATYSGLVQEINRAVPAAVIYDLKRNDDVPDIAANVADDARDKLQEIWKATA